MGHSSKMYIDWWILKALLCVQPSPIFDPFTPPVLYMGQSWWPLVSGKWNCPRLLPPLKRSDRTISGQFIVPWTIYIAKTRVPSRSICPIMRHSSCRVTNQNLNDRPQNICCWEIYVCQIFTLLTQVWNTHKLRIGLRQVQEIHTNIIGYIFYNV